MKLPSAIRHVRLSKGLTQAEFASSLGVGSVDVSRWENGHVTPGLRNMNRLVDAGLPKSYRTNPEGDYELGDGEAA